MHVLVFMRWLEAPTNKLFSPELHSGKGIADGGFLMDLPTDRDSEVDSFTKNTRVPLRACKMLGIVAPTSEDD